jgi:hypothetical protein
VVVVCLFQWICPAAKEIEGIEPLSASSFRPFSKYLDFLQEIRCQSDGTAVDCVVLYLLRKNWSSLVYREKLFIILFYLKNKL